MNPLQSILVALLVGACGGETVTVELNFPSSDTFVRSATARILVVDIDRGEEGTCPDLLTQAELGVLDDMAVEDTGQHSVCEFQAGRIELPDVPEGIKAYIAIAQNDAGDALLTGCVMSDVYIDMPPLTIVMAPTDTYRSLFMVGAARPMCSPEEKCQLGCTEE